ncbi:MAG: hypothetical protein JKY98_02350 [Gammaproteobacteria bacterium]|nr:hypothetical protein [Gammaproteobacteria bacterium]
MSFNKLSLFRSFTINLLKFTLAKLILRICAWLPLGMVQAVAGALGKLMNWRPTRMKQTTVKNLSECFPDLTAEQLGNLTRLSLQHTAMTSLEMGKCWLWPVEKTMGMIVQVEGEEVLEEARSTGKGVVLLGPHLGNWELFGYYFSEQIPSTFMYQAPKNKHFDMMIKSARSRGHARLAPASSQGVGVLLKALKKGELVGILPDQEPAVESGDFAPFFGVPALTMTLVTRLVNRTGARVICGYAERLPKGQGFKIIIKRADPLIYHSDPKKSLEGLNRSVEECVNQAKEQYQWEYKRFKRRPDGSRFYLK